MTYDESVLILESSFVLGPAVKTIALASSRPIAGTMGNVTGWGYLEPTGPISDQLQGVQVPVVDQLQCLVAYVPLPITDTMMCAGYLGEGGKDACKGDSGGALVVGSAQVGIGIPGFTRMLGASLSTLKIVRTGKLDWGGFNKVAMHFFMKQSKKLQDQFIHKHEIGSSDFETPPNKLN
ncbi:Trypsin eta [Folsomia candida]|uniref:Trypsin eta n=1 Tax=Folsomia candida TaxID=158441 RepID=A0A226DRX3_FOLCA|nr:Trypsin eta [Folsomia candida]